MSQQQEIARLLVELRNAEHAIRDDEEYGRLCAHANSGLTHFGQRWVRNEGLNTLARDLRDKLRVLGVSV